MLPVQKQHDTVYLLKAFLLATLVVSLLGYIDCITGEISIEILYVLCIGFVAWYTNIYLGIGSVFEIIVAKTLADYFDKVKVGTHLYGWNALNDILVYGIVCVLVVKLRKSLM